MVAIFLETNRVNQLLQEKQDRFAIIDKTQVLSQEKIRF